MSRNVFILGAGASQEAGGPLMSNFLARAREQYAQQKLEPLVAREEELKKLLLEFGNCVRGARDARRDLHQRLAGRQDRRLQGDGLDY